MRGSKTKARKYSSELNIFTTVKFLDDALKKNCKETAVRKYLLQKQSFSVEKINEAFRVQKARQGYKINEKTIFWGFLVSKDRKRYRLLLPGTQEEGEKLRSDFLQAELEYRTALGCLKENWEKELSSLALERKIKMTIDEVKQIFQHIPKLLALHKNIYLDLLSWSTINFFCKRVPKFFILYTEYAKGCIRIVNIMRHYIFDMRFQSRLREIRKRSRFRSIELNELLVLPLHRIGDYQEFLTELKQMVDSRNSEEYTLLCKAGMRIERLARYAVVQRKEITNKFKMHWVQSFLGSQSNILTPTRKIIYRGLITRRIGSWPSRKKKYFLFLFTDILLWTTVITERQNAARLDSLILEPSKAKNNPHQKFIVLIHKQDDSTNTVVKETTLSFECKSDEQRKEWVEAIGKAIKAFKSGEGFEAPNVADLNLIIEEDCLRNEIKCEGSEDDRFKVRSATPDGVIETGRKCYYSFRKDAWVSHSDPQILKNSTQDCNNYSITYKTRTEKSIGSIDNIGWQNPEDDVHFVGKNRVCNDLNDLDLTSTPSRHSEWTGSSSSNSLQNATSKSQPDSSKRSSSSDLEHRHWLSIVNENSQSGEDHSVQAPQSLGIPRSFEIRRTDTKSSPEMSMEDTFKSSFSILLGDKGLVWNTVAKRRHSCYTTLRLGKV